MCSVKLAVTRHRRAAMAFHHRQRFLGTDFRTVAAVDATQPVNDPFLFRAIHHQRAGGAFLGADGAIDAVVLRETIWPREPAMGWRGSKG